VNPRRSIPKYDDDTNSDTTLFSPLLAVMTVNESSEKSDRRDIAIFGPDWTAQNVSFRDSDDRVRGGSSQVPTSFNPGLALTTSRTSISMPMTAENTLYSTELQIQRLSAAQVSHRKRLPAHPKFGTFPARMESSSISSGRMVHAFLLY